MTDQALALMRDGKLELEELLPVGLLDKLRLMSLSEALDYIHRPPPDADISALIQRDHPTQKRLALRNCWPTT